MSGLPSDLDTYKIQLKNVTEVTTFILMGFRADFQLQFLQFLLFLAIHFFTLLGNVGLVLLVIVDSRLHTPRYYFLSMLSLLDACYSSFITPKMLVNFLVANKATSFIECATQMFLFVTLGTTESFLLAAMAYDHYVAIYNPLLYSVNMSSCAYVPLIITSYFGSILDGTLQTVASFRLSFCASNKIRHVFCNIPPLLAISCSDSHINQLLHFYVVNFIEITNTLIVLISYAFILMAILKMCSADGRQKFFSICGSNPTGVSIFHGAILFMYVRSSSSYSLEHYMIISIFYTILIPMLNPIIYSLRTKDDKEAMKKIFQRNQFYH